MVQRSVRVAWKALDAPSRRSLSTGLNYLNLTELRGYCRRHRIPWAIYSEDAAGKRVRARETDRKSVVLERARKFLRTGQVPPPTVFPASVLRPGPRPRRFRASNRPYHGEYDKHDPAFLGALERPTAGRFRSGAVARILIREFAAADDGLGLAEGRHPEAAFLTDRSRGEAGPDWRAKRTRNAREALEGLATLSGG